MFRRHVCECVCGTVVCVLCKALIGMGSERYTPDDSLQPLLVIPSDWFVLRVCLPCEYVVRIIGLEVVVIICSHVVFFKCCFLGCVCAEVCSLLCSNPYQRLLLHLVLHWKFCDFFLWAIANEVAYAD